MIGAALLASTRGVGHRRIATALGVPAGTVRGWLRAAAVRAPVIMAHARLLSVHLDPHYCPPEPTPSTLGDGTFGDAIEALGTAIAATIRRLGPIAPPWQLAATITGGLLAPARPPGG